MDTKKALEKFIRDYPEYIPGDVDVIDTDEFGVVNDNLSWIKLSHYWFQRLQDCMAGYAFESYGRIITALNAMNDIEADLKTEGPW